MLVLESREKRTLAPDTIRVPRFEILLMFWQSVPEWRIGVGRRRPCGNDEGGWEQWVTLWSYSIGMSLSRWPYCCLVIRCINLAFRRKTKVYSSEIIVIFYICHYKRPTNFRIIVWTTCIQSFSFGGCMVSWTSPLKLRKGVKLARKMYRVSHALTNFYISWHDFRD